ncbi:Lrp/AsnC ligand binding domain-containing protein [Flavobacterium sp. FlaQc-51]|uniref:Lrp/AsnC ligand binding domain-containing protein n=1 Tax=Flavobacterium sp. FlaQc-51 TaxID=3374184 RepID=UPI003756F605
MTTRTSTSPVDIKDIVALPEIIECYNIAGDYDFMLLWSFNFFCHEFHQFSRINLSTMICVNL